VILDDCGFALSAKAMPALGGILKYLAGRDWF
jgi:hypothetical protein